MLRNARGESLVSMGTWPHWHPLKGILSCLVLGDHLTELASSTFSSHLPVCTELFTLCALQGPLSVTQCHLCPAGRLETSFSYSGFLEFLVALAFHFWTSENPANVLVVFPDPGCLFSSVDRSSWIFLRREGFVNNWELTRIAQLVYIDFFALDN